MLLTTLTAGLAAAALGGPGPAHAEPPADGLVSTRSAWVKLSSCSRADRSAAFYARMRRLARGQRMAMRFTLLEHGADGRFAPVDAPALRRWRKSKPGVAAFGYRQRVRGLDADSAYRARVEYRWYDEGGELDRKVTRRSGVCSQSGPLPNLRARIAATGPGGAPGTRRYTVRVANAGLARADDARVRLTVEGTSPQTRTVPSLPAGGALLLEFEASECLTGAVAAADPDDELRESNEGDNSQRLGCGQLPR